MTFNTFTVIDKSLPGCNETDTDTSPELLPVEGNVAGSSLENSTSSDTMEGTSGASGPDKGGAASGCGQPKDPQEALNPAPSKAKEIPLNTNKFFSPEITDCVAALQNLSALIRPRDLFTNVVLDPQIDLWTRA
ncbi:hypothetical protein D9619_008893 [Psilocybe cf. subviscida]|uniref:Uncharacterized protein n=1 Tax=Psilocybe cf. subviscida TaxID=2480587 RepID=A0A8H5B9R6_9AGAR|nr:hypothetical protein D9619_008893 [Psilocybe cf. subviscida]